MRRFLKIWPETLVPSAINLTLYLLIFGSLIGERIGPMAGLSYVEFIVPGLIMLTVIMNAYENVTFSLYLAKFEHSIEEILVAPIPGYVILAGFTAGGIVRGLVVAIMALLVCALFSPISISHPIILLAAVVMASAIFSLAGFINALYANNFDDVSIIPIFVLTPLIYLGGVFYSIELLPEFWQYLARLNPMLYVINVARFGFNGVSEVNLSVAFAIMSGFVALGFYVCLCLLRRGVGLRS